MTTQLWKIFISELVFISSGIAVIGFDKHGIPTIVAKVDHQAELDSDPNAFIRDYMNVVAEYKKTFPSKQDVIDQTPDPAVREMLLRAEQLGIDTAFDRFDKQKPLGSRGQSGYSNYGRAENKGNC